jgi:pimeloyl-ACP methyl ester carboxylesterase
MMEELNRCLSNREVATLTNTTHGLEYENPAEFNKTVLGFIDKQ